jgi:hypothetical protein
MWAIPFAAMCTHQILCGTAIGIQAALLSAQTVQGVHAAAGTAVVDRVVTPAILPLRRHPSIHNREGIWLGRVLHDPSCGVWHGVGAAVPHDQPAQPGAA